VIGDYLCQLCVQTIRGTSRDPRCVLTARSGTGVTHQIPYQCAASHIYFCVRQEDPRSHCRRSSGTEMEVRYTAAGISTSSSVYAVFVINSLKPCVWLNKILLYRYSHWYFLQSRYICLPILLYSLEVCPLTKTDLKSLDFVINEFFMKLFQANNNDTVKICHTQFCFELPSSVIKKRAIKFESSLKHG